MEPLEATVNPFGGVSPVVDRLPPDPEEFRRRLNHSLDVWTSQGLKVAWLEASITRSELVPIAVEAGFTYHHAAEDYILLVLRLQDGALIPQYASHYIGAGGVTLNQNDELLVVSEKHRRTGRPSYKLPGGALHTGEHLADAVVREVLEETGVQTRFDAVVCMRNMHEYRHGKSDIYVVCRLTPLSFDITIQPEEIEECLWMPVTDYLASTDVSVFNKGIVQAAIRSEGFVLTWFDGYDDPSKYEFFMPPDGASRSA